MILTVSDLILKHYSPVTTKWLNFFCFAPNPDLFTTKSSTLHNFYFLSVCTGNDMKLISPFNQKIRLWWSLLKP